MKLSNSRIISLWDSLLNIIDISVTVFMSVSDHQLRSRSNTNYDRGTERGSKNHTLSIGIKDEHVLQKPFLLSRLLSVIRPSDLA